VIQIVALQRTLAELVLQTLSVFPHSTVVEELLVTQLLVTVNMPQARVIAQIIPLRNYVLLKQEVTRVVNARQMQIVPRDPLAIVIITVFNVL
jgi:ABC-type polar amino acid transport system ATPase subunit